MKQYKRIFRFVIVGLTNAAISFGILNLCYYKFGTNKILASVIATSCAVLFSFTLNRSFVFADKSRKMHKQFLPFAAVTISGSLIVINLVYIAMLHLLSGHEGWIVNLARTVTGLHFSRTFVDINVSTLIGALVAMAWNYNGYRWFVFKPVNTEANEPSS